MKKWFNRLSALALASFLFTTATVFAASPDFSSLGANSDNAFDTTQARDGDTVTFTLTINVAEDSDGTGQVTFDVGAATGLTATFPAAAASTTHTATYAVPAGQDGAISVTNITFVNTGAESLINTPGFPHTPTPTNVTVDNTASAIAITAPTKLDNASITDTTIQVTDANGVTAAHVTVDGTTTATTSLYSCVQTNANTVDCTISIDAGGDLVIAATDDTGNANTASETGYIIETTPAAIAITAPTLLSNVSITDTTIQVTDANGVTAANVTVDGTTTATTSLYSCAQTNTNTVDCTISIDASGDLVIAATDDAGNSNTSSQAGYIVETTPAAIAITAPTKLSNAAIVNTTIQVTDANGVTAANVTVDGTTTATTSLYSCMQTNANTVDCTISIDASGDLVIAATDDAGNTNTASETGYIIETTPAAIAITAPTKTDNVSITDTTIQVTDANGVTAANVTVDGTSTATTSLYSCVQTNANTVDCTISIDGSGDLVIAATDDAGNANTASETSYVIETDGPMIAITAPTTLLNVSITDTTIQVTDPSGVTAANVTVDGTTTATTSLYSCVQTNANTVDCTISIDASGDLVIAATDDLGNSNTSSQAGYIVETTPAAIAITAPTKLSNAAIVNTTIQVTDANGVTAANVTVDGTTTATTSLYSCMQTNANTVDCTISIDASGDLVIAATDDAGNTNTASETGYIIETTPAAIAITAPTKTDNVSITDTTIQVTDANGVTAANVTVDGTTTATTSLYSCVQTNANTVDCTISIDGSGDLVIAATDDAGNANTASETGYIIETTGPMIAIVSPTILSNASITDTTVQVTDPSGVTAANVTIDGATTATTSLFSCVQTNANTVDCTISIDASGDLVIAATDDIGNADTATQAFYVIETTPAAIAITAPTKLNNASITDTTIQVTDANGVTAANVTVDGTTTATTSLYSCVQTNANTVDCTISIDASGDLVIAATDDAGNTNTASETGYTVDLGDPDVVSITRQTPASSPTNADTLTWRVTFSEDMMAVDAADFSIAGTTATLGVVAVSASEYDVTASGGDLASLDATATLSFSGGQNVTDLASNTLSSTVPTITNDDNYVVDNTAPTVTETTAVTDPTGDSTPDVVINTDEAGTLTMGGSCGTSSSTTLGTGDTTITLTQVDNVTPLTSATYSDCTVQITDASGNANVATALTSFEVDTIAPIISEVTPISDPTSDNTPDYTFTTDEAGTISYGGDCSSGTTAAVIGNNTVTFNTLADGIHSNCTIQVTDDVSNASTVLNVPAFRVDTIAPSVQSATVATSGNPGFARETQTVTFSVTFNEAVTVTAVNTASDGTSVSNVTTEFDAAASTTDQLIFTVQAGDNGTVTPVVDFDIQDAAGLTTNITSLGVITGTVIEADTTAPTLTPVSIASNNADTSLAITGNNVVVSFTGSETLTGVSGTVFTEVAAASNTGGDDWTLTLMTSGDETEGLAPFTADFSDLAGNAGVQVTAVTDASSVTYDDTPAMVSSASIISGHTYITDAPVYYAGVGQTITLTIDPTEPIQTPTGTILGLAPVFTNTVGDIWTATVTTAGGETEGTVTYSIDIIDLAGTGTPLNVSATTDGTSVVFDETAPTNPTTVLDAEGVETVSPKSVVSALFNWTGEVDALAGVAEFVVRFENTTTGINETSTIVLPARDFTPAAVASSSDPYNVYISTVDKAGNVLAEALLYSQIYAGSLTGSVTDEKTGAPIEGVIVTVIAKYGERCSLIQEVCVATTDAAGNYELVINPNQEYKIDFLKLPNYRIKKQSFFAGAADLSLSAKLTNVENGTIQTGDQRVVYNVSKDGETVEVTVFSFSGDVAAKQVSGGIEFTSFGRIVQAQTDKEGVVLVNQGNNVWFLAGAQLARNASGVSTKSVKRIVGSSSAGGFSGMTRAQNATKGRVLTPAESMAFIKEMNAGSEGQTLYYTNHNGKKIFAGYIKGRLAMMVFAKNSKTPVVYRGYRRERQGYDKDQASVSANQVAINNALNKNKMLKTQKVKSVATANRYESMRRKMAATGQSMPSYINRKDSSARTANMVKYRNDMVAAKENKFARSNGFTQTESRIAKNRKANEKAKLNVIKSTKGVASIMRMIKAEQMQASVINTQEVVSR